MSVWQHENEAFVWTELDGEAYRLLRFNQSSTGVYLVYPDSHHSFHRDGKCHTRSAKHVAEPQPEVPYKIQPLAEIETRLLGTHMFSMNPNSVRTYGERIPRPSDNSRSLRINRSDFRPLTQPVLDLFLYNRSKRGDVIDWIMRRSGHNPSTECLDFKEYALDCHSKILGAFLQRLDYSIAPETTKCEENVSF